MKQLSLLIYLMYAYSIIHGVTLR